MSIKDFFEKINAKRIEMIQYHLAGNWRAAQTARGELMQLREDMNDFITARDRARAHKAFGLSLVVAR